MNELYNFYEKGSDIAKELMSYFTDNGGQFLTPPQGLTTANKSGCAGYTVDFGHKLLNF